ncbi:hypothetical protein HPC49_14265 [Pyxidicoccus fallax]|uniref:DUF7716 domain-containing protein n=1 Tax=Pyxidicoccus fallax TaxID=394095 RepID=A0A848LBF4_9BACT|nr:hypothetical protein [Pyxidicoccus fallax]NMO15816.1 hypothetical protein [Pyxidicoccus fallax]NPC79399.1 hypothetical protein [Pyxidicoccus fallax]
MSNFEWLGNILSRIETYPWFGHALYVEGNAPFETKTRAMVLAYDVYSDEPPPLAVAHGLRRTLSVDQAQGIVMNARMQRPEVTPSELVQAFNYYWKRDAFIDFSRQ